MPTQINIDAQKEQRVDKGLCVPDSATGFGRREQGRDTGSAAWLEAGKWMWQPLYCQDPFVMRRPQQCDVPRALLTHLTLHSRTQ